MACKPNSPCLHFCEEIGKFTQTKNIFSNVFPFFPPLSTYISLFSLAFSTAFLLSFNGWLRLIKGSLRINQEVLFLFYFCFFFGLVRIFFMHRWHECLRQKELCVFVVLIKCSPLKIGLLDVQRGNYVLWFILVRR